MGCLMLYKYTRIDDYLKSILLDGYIFGAKPDVLNDPYETRLCMTADGVDVDDYIKFLYKQVGAEERLSPAKRLIEERTAKRNFKNNPEKCLVDIENAMNLHSLNFARIVSLSSDKNNPLLWSLLTI